VPEPAEASEGKATPMVEVAAEPPQPAALQCQGQWAQRDKCCCL